MHLISITNLREDAAQYPDADRVIRNWFKTIEQAQWQNLEEVRQSFKDAEAVGNFTVFNIKGNNYRLIVGIDYESKTCPMDDWRTQSPTEMLQYLLETSGKRQSDLVGIIGSSGIVSEVVNGKRAISKSQAKKLGEIFKVSPSLFI